MDTQRMHDAIRICTKWSNTAKTALSVWDSRRFGAYRCTQNVFFRAQNGKVGNKSKKALTGKGGGDNITEHAAESCEPDL